MAVTGHKNVAGIKTYVRAASQQHLARDAMAKLESATENGHPADWVARKST
jgi:hypothetical protein